MRISIERRASGRPAAAARACRLTTKGFLLAAVWGSGFACQTQAALREERVIYPGPGWEYADTGTRDLGVLPAGGWTSTDPVWPNLYWQRLTLSIPPSWSSKRVLVRVGACAYFVRAYLNGHLLGSHYGPVTPFEADMTPYINGSGPNVLMLAVQDWSALLSPSVGASNNGLQIGQVPDPSIQGPLAFAVWMYHPRLWTQDIRLRAAPNVRVTDVFVRPSVRQSKLDVDLTIRNDDTSSHTVSIDNLVTKWNNPAADKTFPASALTVPQGTTATTTVTLAWSNPILWTPTQPQLYSLTTTLSEGGTPLDSLGTRFGFREFWIEENADHTRSWFVLNGVRQNLRAEGLWHANLGDAYLNTYVDWLKANNFNCLRITNGGRESYYDMADEKGILIQSEIPFYFRQKYTYDTTFWSRAQTYLTDQIRAWRNHPSIVFWGVENEVMLTSPGQAIGANLLALEHASLALDPTRVVMHEGDGDLRTIVIGAPSPGYDVRTINIHNYDILVEPWKSALDVMDFPNAAYVFGETTGAAVLPGYAYGTVLPDRSKPWFIGEFGPGAVINNPHAQAFFNGDACYPDLFGQAAGLMGAMGLNYGFQIEGYRYFDHVCGIAPWASYSGDPSILDGPVIRTFFEPVTARIKEWTHHFFAGDTISRTITIYNDDVVRNSHFDLHWRLVHEGRDLVAGDWNVVSEPGFLYRDALTFTAPATRARLDATLVLELSIGGTLVDTVTQDISIFPARAAVSVPNGRQVLLYDPNYPSYSVVPDALAEAGVRFTQLAGPDPTGHPPGLFIIGFAGYPASVPPATVSAIRTWVREGGTLLVYGDQWTHPPWVSFFGDPTYNVENVWGRPSTIGFLRAPHHPVLAGLQVDDLKWWAPDHELVSRSAGTWSKPSSGAFTVLVDTGGRNLGLGDSPLCEYPDGKGVTIVCRLLMFEKLSQEPVTRILLQNLLHYAAVVAQRPSARGLGVLTGAGSQTAALLDRIRIDHESLNGRLSAHTVATLSDSVAAILIDNDAAVWTEVDANRTTLQGFVNTGGKVILRRIGSARVAQANALTGVSMTTKATQLRHPQLEKRTDDPMLDGVSNDDVFWVYPTAWRNQAWASAIVQDVISFTESSRINGLLVEPSRTGILNPDSGQSYAIGAAERDPGVAIDQPGWGLVRIRPPSGAGYYLVDQLCWDASMDTPLVKKAQRYLTTILSHALRPPQAGIDRFTQATALLYLLLPDGTTETISLAGPATVYVTVGSEGQAGDADGDELDDVAAELAQLDLRGSGSTGPIRVTLDPRHSSTGQVEEIANSTPHVLDIAPFNATGQAHSFFDVSLRVEFAGQVLCPSQPIRLQAVIANIPPGPGEPYQTLAGMSPLLNEGGEPTEMQMQFEVYMPSPPLAGAALDFGRLPDGSLRITWPAPDTYVLQTSAALPPAIQWTNVPGPYPVPDRAYGVNPHIENPRQFFRLFGQR